ncbi:UNVERIFIED_CONTAM: Peptide deformylase 1A, chloroplastic [Sesamum calycinum]|uniref:Peptide deformylase n=1 Tax=Sesamum calycinum TaxID=2727403 RepID=A0AAW2NF22_9LAMI
MKPISISVSHRSCGVQSKSPNYIQKQKRKIKHSDSAANNGKHSQAHSPHLSLNLQGQVLEDHFKSPNPDPTREWASTTRIYSAQKKSQVRFSCPGGLVSGKGERKNALPDIVKAGDPVLHEPAQEVGPEEIGSERIQKIIDDMVKVMRKAPGVGLAAPQIGIPLRIIVLEDTKEYISYASKQETTAQDRRPFDLLVVINPKLKKKGNKTAFFLKGV